MPATQTATRSDTGRTATGGHHGTKPGDCACRNGSAKRGQRGNDGQWQFHACAACGPPGS
ncbi:hypothetical protein BKK79_06095 [Cupriavidus sp. USMAA2-4]|nr:hypothetical protein BKK79_06095 [Cupriavidus sp. USMAA2-4]